MADGCFSSSIKPLCEDMFVFSLHGSFNLWYLSLILGKACFCCFYFVCLFFSTKKQRSVGVGRCSNRFYFFCFIIYFFFF
jgi:hypothetical protein